MSKRYAIYTHYCRFYRAIMGQRCLKYLNHMIQLLANMHEPVKAITHR